MLKNFVYIFALITATFGYSQQDPLYSQYMFNPIVINPAYAGLYDMTSVTLGYREQWAGIQGAPTTFSGNIHSTVPLDNMGVGFTFVHERYGASRNTDMSLQVSYNIPTGYYSKISMGLQGTLNNYAFDVNAEGLQFQEDTQDPVFYGDFNNVWNPNFGFGLLYNSRRFFLGASVPKLLDVALTTSSDTSQFTVYNPHYYFTTGYVIRLRDNLKLRPSTLVKITEGFVSIDANASILYENVLWAGVSLRNLNTVALMGQLILKDKVRLGLAYEIPTSGALLGLNDGTIGSLEFMVNFNFSILDVHAVQIMYY